MSVFDSFVKKHEYLVCVDSDGCAMDTMNCKHFNCFGPCMVDIWELGKWRDEILDKWNHVNLFSMTRGINRFKGLAIALEEVNEKYKPVIGVNTLIDWANSAPALSNDGLAKAIGECSDPDGRRCLEMALEWSKAVNESITKLPDELKVPFIGAYEGLEAAHKVADVAVVSSANKDAVIEEWQAHNLLGHTDILLTQDCGSKAHCIERMLEFGYAPDKVLMVGDAPGDRDAARKNGVLYFPILVGREAESWEEFKSEALAKLTSDSYKGEYQNKKISEFISNLGG